MIELIRKAKPQFKANLHAHSKISDGRLTPEEMKKIYREKGYSILCITDHNIPCPHSDLTEKDFLMLTGYEADIRDDVEGKTTYLPTAHLCLYARDPENRTLIWFDEARFNGADDPRRALNVAPPCPRSYTPDYINAFIQTAKQNGYIVAHNHFAWSLEPEAQVLAYEGLFSMEICNGGCWLVGNLEYNAALYDKMLRRGMRIFCHGTDDNHNVYQEGPECDSFVAYTYVLADELTYDSVFSALEKGDFYASRGPQIHSLTMDGRHARIECSNAKVIYAYFGGKDALFRYAPKGESLTVAEFDIREDAPYVRFSVFDEYGNSADTRGYFADELGWNQ